MNTIINNTKKVLLFVIELAAMLVVLLLLVAVVANDPFDIVTKFSTYMTDLKAAGFAGFLSLMVVLGIYAYIKCDCK